jgi:amino acid adenylation domain-containing protein
MTFLLQTSVTRQAERLPDRGAVVGGGERMTYAELEAESNRLARMLRDQGCRRGDRVCLLVPKSPWAVVAMLGVLKSDCAYVPIDLASPAARIEKMIRSVEPRVLLLSASTASLIGELDTGALSGVRIGSIDEHPPAPDRSVVAFCRSDWASCSTEPVGGENTASDAAHILFTSGSTGTPKGVVVTHANVAHFLAWAVPYFGIDESDRTSGHPPFHFDLSTFDIHGAFMAGAELHLVPPELNLLPHELARFIGHSDLTQWFSVPSVLTYMAKADVVRPGDFPFLERVLWCGEVMPTPTLIYFMERLPHVRFTNLYGPTEATIASSFYTVPAVPEAPTDPIPIGLPCEGERLVVLDGDMRPVHSGQVGELYIGGVGVSPGYWRDDARTRDSFVTDPTSGDPGHRLYRTGDLAMMDADGLFYFLGRRDSQIKSRGHRIEMGEIEAGIRALDGLQECAVVAVPAGAFEGWAICCAYAPVPGRDVQPAELVRGLRSLVPEYMVPVRWRCFDRLPKNANGKIDRRLLGDLFRDEV